MSKALVVLKEERTVLAKQLSAVDAAIAALSGEPTKKKKQFGPKRVVSSSLKKKLRKAAKERWAKAKAAGRSHL